MKDIHYIKFSKIKNNYQKISVVICGAINAILTNWLFEAKTNKL